jgi:hypothetical protein
MRQVKRRALSALVWYTNRVDLLTAYNAWKTGTQHAHTHMHTYIIRNIYIGYVDGVSLKSQNHGHQGAYCSCPR